MATAVAGASRAIVRARVRANLHESLMIVGRVITDVGNDEYPIASYQRR